LQEKPVIFDRIKDLHSLSLSKIDVTGYSRMYLEILLHMALSFFLPSSQNAPSCLVRRKAGLGTPHIGPAFPETKEMDGGGALYETYIYIIISI
jgi:hypothetical protein